MSSKSRPSRISDDTRAWLFAVVERPDDGRVDRAISMLISRYLALLKASGENPPPIQQLPVQVEEDFDDEFS
jgi:hypothetical protein